MKKIQKERTITETITTYVSIDGKEFNNQEDCEAWEKSYRGTLEASIQSIKKINVSANDIGLPYASDDYEVWVVKPQSMEEITLINAYTDCVTCHSADTITADMIGKEIALNFGYERDYCDVHVLAKHIQNLTSEVARIAKEFADEEEN